MKTLRSEQALQELLSGNERYVTMKSIHPNQTAERRKEVLEGQHPFATIITCSDSRVPPEIIFDCGIGDIFVIRVAGNIVDDLVMGSVEYAADHLGVKLIVVLGHTNCGAVTASVNGGEVCGHISSFIEAIKPAVEKVKDQPGDLIDNTIRANVKMVVEQLNSSEAVIAKLVKKCKLVIVGAIYDLESGAVEILS